jgi:hypothetical protein
MPAVLQVRFITVESTIQIAATTLGMACWDDRMTPDQYSALQRLADVPRGMAKTLMLAYGFTHDLIADLVLTGLATVAPDIAIIGEQLPRSPPLSKNGNFPDKARRPSHSEVSRHRKPLEQHGPRHLIRGFDDPCSLPGATVRRSACAPTPQEDDRRS